MLTYAIFGLIISSELVLAELTPTLVEGPADLTIRRTAPAASGQLLGDEAHVECAEGQVTMSYPGVGVFTLRPDDLTIEASVEPGADRLASLPLLGPVMAVHLHLSGKLVLHASAVQRQGRAIGFVGDKGAGKSTTAAACLRAGADLITDDLLVCNVSDERGAFAEPGGAQLKLNADSVVALPLASGDALASPHPLFSKQILRLPELARTPTPMAAICELVRGDRLVLTQLNPAEALGVVLRFGYVARYGPTFLSGSKGAAHFRRSIALADTGVVWRLQVAGSLRELELQAREMMDGLIARSPA